MFWKTSQNSQINTKSSHPEVLCQKMFLKICKIHKKHLCPSLFFNEVAVWKPKPIRSSHWRCSVIKVALKNFANFKEKHLCWNLFLIMLQYWGNLLNKTPTQELSYEIFKTNYFEEHLWTIASKLYLKRDSSTDFFLWILWIIWKQVFCRASANGWFWNTSEGVSL